tara:strand:+ start:1470 stop:1685 length:216 start_codon:yes stop_codon:yes gene_type:complete
MMDIGPPIIIPIVPVKNMINAFDPSFLISGKSILTVSKTRLAGSKYLEATKYNLELSPEIIPKELNIDGIK